MKTEHGFLPVRRRHADLTALMAGAFAVAALAMSSLPPALAGEAVAPFGPTTAAEINHTLYSGWSSDALRAEFPMLPQGEFERLVFRIADVWSMDGLTGEAGSR